ncbi:hypothetical protein Trydic_g17784 [Trypoxylus dichotomus]
MDLFLPKLPKSKNVPLAFGEQRPTRTRAALFPLSPRSAAFPFPISFLNPGKFRSSCRGQGQLNRRRERLKVFPPLRFGSREDEDGQGDAAWGPFVLRDPIAVGNSRKNETGQFTGV